MALQHGRRNGFSSGPPHFFKILFEDNLRGGKLGIPPKFAKEYGNTLLSPVVLKVPTGALWEVELTNCDGIIWLQNGWKNFAEHYSLEHGHFLVFRYEGNSHFRVLIFDRSASEIQYPYANEDEEIQQQEATTEESDSDEDSVQIVDDTSTGRREKPQVKCGRPYKMMRTNPSVDKTERGCLSSAAAGFGCANGSSAGKSVGKSTTARRVRQLKPHEKLKVLQRAGFSSKNPYFIVVMQAAYVGGNYCLGIPTDFARKHFKDHDHVILCNSEGKTWSAACYSFVAIGSGLPYVKIGWFTFARDNNIKVGDICAFQLINPTDQISFKVFIDRGQAQEANFQGSRASTGAFRPERRAAGTLSNHQGYRKPFRARGSTLQAARASTSRNPFCIVTVGCYPRVYVPGHFASRYLPETLRHADVDLCMNGKSWPVRYHQQSANGRTKPVISRGWRAFCQDNNLKVGDICVLEMTKENSEISFDVFVYKDIADANRHPSQGVIGSLYP